jgi:hypothetical protein
LSLDTSNFSIITLALDSSQFFQLYATEPANYTGSYTKGLKEIAYTGIVMCRSAKIIMTDIAAASIGPTAIRSACVEYKGKMSVLCKPIYMEEQNKQQPVAHNQNNYTMFKASAFVLHRLPSSGICRTPVSKIRSLCSSIELKLSFFLTIISDFLFS